MQNATGDGGVFYDCGPLVVPANAETHTGGLRYGFPLASERSQKIFAQDD